MIAARSCICGKVAVSVTTHLRNADTQKNFMYILNVLIYLFILLKYFHFTTRIYCITINFNLAVKNCNILTKRLFDVIAWFHRNCYRLFTVLGTVSLGNDLLTFQNLEVQEKVIGSNKNILCCYCTEFVTCLWKTVVG